MTGKMPSRDTVPACGPAEEKGLAHRWGRGLWVLLRRCRKSRLQVTSHVGVKETEPLSSEAVTPRSLRWTHHPTWDTETTRTVRPRMMIDQLIKLLTVSPDLSIVLEDAERSTRRNSTHAQEHTLCTKHGHTERFCVSNVLSHPMQVVCTSHPLLYPPLARDGPGTSGILTQRHSGEACRSVCRISSTDFHVY